MAKGISIGTNETSAITASVVLILRIITNWFMKPQCARGRSTLRHHPHPLR